MKILMKTIFGSHLYGTDTSKSDQDFKGVFLPTREQILLGRIPKSFQQSSGNDKSKNGKDDVDIEIYSLHYFIELACQGQTVALDMLHAPKSILLEYTPIWEEIVANRSLFYTKNLNAFIGYARKQAGKYGVKGSRLNAAKEVLEFIKGGNEALRLSDIWDVLPEGEHIYKHPPDKNGIMMYEVCGRKTSETSTINRLKETVAHFYNNYGARAKAAAKNEGIDWKAVSHAIRAAYQTKEILTKGTITFPLIEAPYIRKVKAGELDYTTEVAPKLEELIAEVERLSLKSNLPNTCDREYWDRFLINVITSII